MTVFMWSLDEVQKYLQSRVIPQLLKVSEIFFVLILMALKIRLQWVLEIFLSLQNITVSSSVAEHFILNRGFSGNISMCIL